MTTPSLARALDFLAAGDWQHAHEIVQKEQSELAAWLHGIVHILEGDLKNARGWYERAHREFPGADAAQAEITAARHAVTAAAETG
jgi:exopolyphosphatase/pppGpp-phosphohydrolase